MKRLFFAAFALAMAGLILGAGRASAWTKDPDMAVDAAKVVAANLLLPAPDTTLGDTDTTIAGIGAIAVGSGDITAFAADPPSSGHTFWVDSTPLSGDCPQATYLTIQAAVTASGPNDT